MASGNTLFSVAPHGNQPPAANGATLDTLNSSLAISFVNGSQTYAIFGGVLSRNYTSGGITLRIMWTSSAGAGNVVWTGQFERHQSGVDDLSGDSYAAAVSTTVAVPGANLVAYTDIAFTNGAEIDGLLVGESFRLRISRNGSSGSDTATAAALLFRAELRET